MGARLPASDTGGRRWLRLGLVVAAVFLVAFVVQRLLAPSDSGIRHAIDAAMTSDDPASCLADITETFAVQRYKAPPPFADDFCRRYASHERAEDVDVSDIEVAGDRATAKVAVAGGTLDGMTVQVEMVKRDGHWKVNRVLRFVSFDRASFEQSYRREFVEFGSPASAGTCAIAKTRRLNTEQLEQISLTGDPVPSRRIAVECDRAGVERDLIGGFRHLRTGSLPRDVVACVAARIRSSSDQELVRISAQPVAYAVLGFDCNRPAMLSSIRRHLRGYEDLGAAGAKCVIGVLHKLPSAAIVRVTYDEAAYDRVIAGCNR